MKTQIITLAAHDDLISVRDRMSWAKSPRILLIWPGFEHVTLRPLDMRILQQHARQLGAHLGMVTRRSEVRRAAESFGIPVFQDTADAQRGPWLHHSEIALTWQQKPRKGSKALRAQAAAVRQNRPGPRGGAAVRILFFGLGVLAVLNLASLFVPRATIHLQPISQTQSAELVVEVDPEGKTGMFTGENAPQEITVTLTGTKSMPIQSAADVPTSKSSGTVEFRNLTPTPLVIPSGTVVYSLAPRAARFVTLEEIQLSGGTKSSAEAPIEAVEPGAAANVPEKSIVGLEGHLSALAAVTNAKPTSGGVDQRVNVPTQTDRDGLRSGLLQDLQRQAEAGLNVQLSEGDVPIPGAAQVVSIQAESYDPPAGQPGRVLNLSMTATYGMRYIRGLDLRALAEVALDSSIPAGFVGREGTFAFSTSRPDQATPADHVHLQVRAQRTIVQGIESQTASELVRGRSPLAAQESLESAFPLAGAPSIQLAPSWWPWLPLIPFRVEVVVE